MKIEFPLRAMCMSLRVKIFKDWGFKYNGWVQDHFIYKLAIVIVIVLSLNFIANNLGIGRSAILSCDF